MRMITIGRDNSCDIVINDQRVSRVHAYIIQNEQNYTYRDLSTNGTSINGVLVRKSDINIKFGDSVILANAVPLPWNKVEKLLPPESDDSYIKSSFPLSKIKNQKDSTELPEHMRNWNWGAFGLYSFWGFANGMWWLFLIAVITSWLWPIPNIILGINGNKWAWQNKQWRDINHFESVQQSWKAWGIVAFILQIITLMVYVILVLKFET